MLKKVFSILALGSLSVSFALAQEDILALVSKGRVTSNSVGVTKLNIEEKKQVKGGIHRAPYIRHELRDNYGNLIMKYDYYEFILSPYEKNRGMAIINDRESTYQKVQNYLDFKRLTVVDPRYERAMMFVRIDYKARQIMTEIVAYDTRYNTQRRIYQGNPIIEKLNKVFRDEIIRDSLSSSR
ncbi:hypothetical protein [Helicobacter mesocricetorum]|uniref:hypothetical protein n=1 Tax=Helicobacter mesocricetorum TaxID=87012 RepID=UPI000CF10D4A|nr:hypothetical protein [Helicobacter mesocricetorum]